MCSGHFPIYPQKDQFQNIIWKKWHLWNWWAKQHRELQGQKGTLQHKVFTWLYSSLCCKLLILDHILFLISQTLLSALHFSLITKSAKPSQLCHLALYSFLRAFVFLLIFTPSSLSFLADLLQREKNHDSGLRNISSPSLSALYFLPARFSFLLSVH